MDTGSLLEKLRSLKPHLNEMNIRRMAVFGSHARGEARNDSDVDLLIEFIDTPGYMDFVETKHKLESLLGVPVDLVTFKALKTERHKKILDEAINV